VIGRVASDFEETVNWVALEAREPIFVVVSEFLCLIALTALKRCVFGVRIREEFTKACLGKSDIDGGYGGHLPVALALSNIRLYFPRVVRGSDTGKDVTSEEVAEFDGIPDTEKEEADALCRNRDYGTSLYILEIFEAERLVL
jgi:hypothetical protein